MQLILTNPSARVVRLMERSGLINKIGRDWIFVRVHDAVVNCQRSLMQMEAGGSLPGWHPMDLRSPVYSSGGGADGDGVGNGTAVDVRAAAISAAEGAGQRNGTSGGNLVQLSQMTGAQSGVLRAAAIADLDKQPSL